MSGDAIEARKSHAYFTFGRFQPPTIGHKILIDSLASQAAEADADAYVFVSSRCNDLPKYLKSRKYKAMIETHTFETCDTNENPLSVYQKVKWLKLMYPDTSARIINTTEHECRTIFAIADKLRSAGYTAMTMVVGSDRVPAFEKMFEMSKNINVQPAGAARNNSNKPTGMSGTKMRQAAVKGDLASFKSGVMIGHMTDALAAELMQEVRTGLGYNVSGGLRRKTRRNKTRKSVRIIERSRKSYRLRVDECS